MSTVDPNEGFTHSFAYGESGWDDEMDSMIAKLGATLFLYVLSATTAAEPGSPTSGDRYIVPASATGTNWSGNDGKIAVYVVDTWYFYTPKKGWRTKSDDDGKTYFYNGTIWYEHIFNQSLGIPSGFSIETIPFVPNVKKVNGSWQVFGYGANYNRPRGKKYYVSTTGNNANPGTEASPFRDIPKAMSMPDVDEVYVASGTYDRSDVLGASPSRDVSIICPSGYATFASWEDLTWSLTGGRTYTYQATRSNVYDVLDSSVLDSYGLYTRYENVVDVDAVEATPGSWYTDGATVYVHRSDDTAVDNDIKCPLTVKTGFVLSHSVYFENIIFAGGSAALQLRGYGTDRVRLGAKNCKAYYSQVDNFDVTGNVDAILEDCEVGGGLADGYNYSYYSVTGYSPTFVEINCTSFYNGESTSTISNASTSHNDTVGIRIGGNYYDCYGPIVADVDTTQTWNIDCSAANSLAASNDYDWQTENDMWLDSCTGTDFDDYSGSGTFYTYNTVVSGSTGYERNSEFSLDQIVNQRDYEQPNLTQDYVVLDSASDTFDSLYAEKLFVQYTDTGAVTITMDDILKSANWKGVYVADKGQNASTNNITIQDSTPTTIATISTDGGCNFVFSDGTNFYSK